MIVAGLTLCLAIATATVVAGVRASAYRLRGRIKQFRTIPVTGKVVAGPCMMAMPLFHSQKKMLRRQTRKHRIPTP